MKVHDDTQRWNPQMKIFSKVTWIDLIWPKWDTRKRVNNILLPKNSDFLDFGMNYSIKKRSSNVVYSWSGKWAPQGPVSYRWYMKAPTVIWWATFFAFCFANYPSGICCRLLLQWICTSISKTILSSYFWTNIKRVLLKVFVRSNYYALILFDDKQIRLQNLQNSNRFWHSKYWQHV